jgi:hypothetical protein
MKYSYYDPVKNWRRIRPHLPEVEHILVRDFNKFTWGMWRKKFKPGQLPHEFENSDWWLERRGRHPAYWGYVKRYACHHLVNHNLELAQRARPQDQWRIVTSDKHSTVYNGHGLLFDLNFCALRISPRKAFKLASTDGKFLAPGEHLPVFYGEHYTEFYARWAQAAERKDV